MTIPSTVIDEFTLLCERCGYVIEGLPDHEVCPECSKPIAQSFAQRRRLHPTFWHTLTSPRATLDEMGFDGEGQDRFGPVCGILTTVFGVTALATIVFSMVFIDPGAIARVLPSLIGMALVPLVAVFVLFYGVIWTHVVLLVAIAGLQQARMTLHIARCICSAGCAGLFLFALGAGLVIGAFVGGVILTLETFYDEVVIRGEPVPTLRVVDALAWIGCLIGAAGFLFFETFAWLGLRRLKYANRLRPPGQAPPEPPAPPAAR